MCVFTDRSANKELDTLKRSSREKVTNEQAIRDALRDEYEGVSLTVMMFIC